MFSIPPETPRKQRNEREKLYPAENHHEHKYPFGGNGEENVWISWSHQTDTRAHITQCGYRSTNGCIEVDTREEQDDTACHKHQEIDEDKGNVFVDSTGGDGFSVDFHGQHGVGVDDALQLKHWVLHEDEMTENLDAACGGARTAADEHQQEKDDTQKDRPSCVITDEKASGGEGRDNAKERFTEGGTEASVGAENQDQPNEYAHRKGVKQESPKLLVSQDGERLPTQREQE